LEDHLPQKALVLDLKNLIYMDTSGADALLSLTRACQQRGVRLVLCGLAHQPLDMAQRSGLLALLPQAQVGDDLVAGLGAALAR